MRIRVQNKIIRLILSIRVQKNSFSFLSILRILREKQIHEQFVANS